MTFASSLLSYVLLPYVATTLAIYALAYSLPEHRSHLPFFIARCLASVASLAVSSAFGVFASLILRLAGLAGLGQWAAGRCFKWTMWISTGVWIEILDEGSEHLKTRPAVFVGNHQT
jgi:lysophosphatidate acyltransferase